MSTESASSHDNVDQKTFCHVGCHTLGYLNVLREGGLIDPEEIHSVLNAACGDAYESVTVEAFFPYAHISACDIHLPSGHLFQRQQKCLSRTEFFTTDMERVNTLPKAEKPFDFVLIQHPNVGFCAIDVWLQNIYASLGKNATVVIVLLFSEEYDVFMRKFSRGHLSEFYDIVFEGKNPTPAELGMNHLIVLKPPVERKSPEHLSACIADSIRTVLSDKEKINAIYQLWMDQSRAR